MRCHRSMWIVFGVLMLAQLGVARHASGQGPSLGGFVPFVGIGLTDEFKEFDDPLFGGTFFVADPATSIGGTQLGTGGTPYYDLAILDSGAATHILTQEAFTGFDLANPNPAFNFVGTETQPVGGLNGVLDLSINDALGVYAAGLGDRDPATTNTNLVMQTGALRGQTSFATLTAPEEWDLPNIIGLPMAAQHAIAILNSDPQIFQFQDRTLRTPNVELRDLGSGGGGILRRTALRLQPAAGFINGPLYVFNFGLNDDILNLNLHEDPSSPSLVENAALFVEVDLNRGDKGFEDKPLLIDTGADFTVVSQLTAKRLGYDPILDTPDFFLEAEGVGGVQGGIPGIFLDELNIDTVGGSFTLHNVPVAVIDLPNPGDPGNTLDGILGMNVFNGRDIVIDAIPAIGQGGNPPALYISDPVTDTHNWATSAVNANWGTPGNWSTAGTPGQLWVANVANVSGSDQTAMVSADSTVFQMTVAGTPSARMTVHVEDGVTLTTFGETLIQEGGRVELDGGKLDTQFVNIVGGTLAGSGDVFAGTGPVHSPVRNLSGRVEPGNSVGLLSMDGDYSQQAAGTLAIELGGTPDTQYDQLDVGRFAFLDGNLEVALIDLGGGVFTPQVGNMFTILTTGEGVSGQFSDLLLPGGFQWDVVYGTNDVVLSVVGLGLLGDYNLDNKVGPADYTVWRNTLGDSVPPGSGADGDYSGTIDEGDYAVWKGNYGMSIPGSGSGASATAPEPASALLLVMGIAFAILQRRKSVTR